MNKKIIIIALIIGLIVVLSLSYYIYNRYLVDCSELSEEACRKNDKCILFTYSCNPRLPSNDCWNCGEK